MSQNGDQVGPAEAEGSSAHNTADESDLDNAYLDELVGRWYGFLEAELEEGPQSGDLQELARSRLTDWLASAPDVSEAHFALAGMAYAYTEELGDEDDLLAALVLGRAGLLCRLIDSAIFAELVLELCDLLMDRLPGAVLATIDRLGALLVERPGLAEALFDDGPADVLDWLAGRAWLQLDDAEHARERFLRAYRLADLTDRFALEFMIASCTAALGEVDEAAEWIIRAEASRAAEGQEEDPDFIETAGEIVLTALGVQPPTPSRAAAYERFRDAYLAHPEWCTPIVGEVLYLAAAAEIHEDRGDWAAANDMIERAAAKAEATDVSAEDRAEIAISRARIALTSGQVTRALASIRQASAAVAFGTDTQKATLAALAAAAMSSFGQSDPARQELERLAVPRVDRWADIEDGAYDKRLGFVLGHVDEVVELTRLTLENLSRPDQLAAISHRWLTLADRVAQTGGADPVIANLLRHAALTARMAGQGALATTLIERAREMERRWPGAAGTTSGAAEFTEFVEQAAVGDPEALIARIPELASAAKGSNDFLYAVMTWMDVLARRIRGATPEEVFSFACIALQTHTRWRAQFPSSLERHAFDERLELVLPTVYETVSGLEPRLIAEFIEFVRSQAMPEAQVTATSASVSMQRLLGSLQSEGLPVADGAMVALDDEIVLGRSSQVRMPWGTVALAGFLEPSDDPVVELDIPW